MILTTRMTQLFAVVPATDRERVTDALLRAGVLHFVTVSEFETHGLAHRSASSSEASLSDITDLRKRTEGILHTVGALPSPPTETDLNRRAVVKVDQDRAHLDRIDRDRETIRERQRSLQQEILKLERGC